MSQKNNVKTVYTIAQAQVELTQIHNDLNKAITGAEARRADVARKLSQAGIPNTEIVKLFADNGIKISAQTVGRDVIVSKVLAISPDADYTTLTQAIATSKTSGVTQGILKEIIENPKLTKAEKRAELATVIPETPSTKKVKASPREKWEIAGEYLAKIVEWVGNESLNVHDAIAMLNDTVSELETIASDLESDSE